GREALHALLHPRACRFGRALDARGEILECGLAVLDQTAQHPEREQTALATLLLQDDLGKRHGGEVFAALVLEYLYFLAGLHPPGDLVEGDVTALTRVVQLPVAIPFD